jgi:predicted metal-binding protein
LARWRPFPKRGEAAASTLGRSVFKFEERLRVTLSDIAESDDPDIAARPATTIYVCITCRRQGDPETCSAPGLRLAEAASRAAEGTGIAVRRVRCLANCNRALSAAIRRDGAWTYVFGTLDPDRDAAALVEGALLFAGTRDPIMPWRGRPEVLKRGLIARVPPIDFEEESE